MNKFLNLFSFCKVIQGKENAILCDFQKKNLKYIPYSMVEVITMLSKHQYAEVETFFSDQKNVFKSYINLLLREKFAFFSDVREEFTPISDIWESPQTINNAIIEYNYQHYKIIKLIKQLDNLNCQFLEIRFLSYDEKCLKEIEEILQFCDDLVLRSIRIYLPFINHKVSLQIYHQLKKFKKLEVTVFYGSNKTKIQYNKHNILFTTKTMEYIRKKNFDDTDLIIDFEYYRESLKYNPYYNKKISVDYLGNIKNCIKNRAVFGNLNKNSIEQILNETDIKEFWNINPNMIVHLKNDELRYNKLISNDLNKISENLYEIVE
jgi:SPASM domain peptide maturase of grasp-with-spasm system